MRFGGGSKEIWHAIVKAFGKNAWSLLDVPSPSSGEIYFSFFSLELLFSNRMRSKAFACFCSGFAGE